MKKKYETNGIGFKSIAKYGVILESYRILEYLVEKGIKFETVSSYHLDYDWYVLDQDGTNVVVAVSQGAPMAVDLAERYLSSGVEYICRIGTTGAMVDDIELGNIAVPIASIKDEGTSDFYIDKKAPAIGNLEFIQKIIGGFEKNKLKYYTGISWSTDGRWKETDDMIETYLDSGAVFADMESSALFSFGLNRKAKVASLSVLSDEIKVSDNDDFKGLSDEAIWFDRVLPKMLDIFNSLVQTYKELDNEKNTIS